VTRHAKLEVPELFTRRLGNAASRGKSSTVLPASTRFDRSLERVYGPISPARIAPAYYGLLPIPSNADNVYDFCKVTPMARWVLECRKCKVEITHSTINDIGVPYLSFIPKPEFPPGGSTVECPNCGHKALYQRTDLTYRATRTENARAANTGGR
jgi:hypothetical protein